MTIPLDQLPPSQWAAIALFKGGEKMHQRMTQHGIYPGDKVRIIRTAPLKGPYLVEVSGREIILGRTLAAHILVETEEKE